MSKALPTKEIEFWLLGWNHSHNRGSTVTFQISDEDREYFERATVRKGKVAGQRYAGVLVQLTDDEQPDPESVKPLPDAARVPAGNGVEQLLKSGGMAKAHELAEAAAGGASVVAESAVSPLRAMAAFANGCAEKAERVPSKARFPGGYCGLAVRWCDDVHFREWLEFTFPELWDTSARHVKLVAKGADIERAALVVKWVCKVSTRKELDTDEAAHAMFRVHIFNPYTVVRKEDGRDDEVQQ